MTSYLGQRLKDTEEKNKNNLASLAGLEHEVQQSCLATEADARIVKKTRKRTEGAAADRVKNGDNSSARLDDDPTSLTSFGNIAEPPAPE